MTTAIVEVPGKHHEDVDTVGRRQRTGVLLLILADVAFVAALVFSYFYLRGLNTEGQWVAPGGHTAAIWVGWAIAAGTVLAALAYRGAALGIRAGNVPRLVAGSGLALLVIVLALAGQVVQLATLPFKPNADAYASSIYVIAGANLFHLVLTLFLGLGIWNRSRMAKYSKADYWQVDIVGIWFAWVAVAALGGALATSFIASPNIVH